MAAFYGSGSTISKVTARRQLTFHHKSFTKILIGWGRSQFKNAILPKNYNIKISIKKGRIKKLYSSAHLKSVQSTHIKNVTLSNDHVKIKIFTKSLIGLGKWHSWIKRQFRIKLLLISVPPMFFNWLWVLTLRKDSWKLLRQIRVAQIWPWVSQIADKIRQTSPTSLIFGNFYSARGLFRLTTALITHRMSLKTGKCKRVCWCLFHIYSNIGYIRCLTHIFF